MKNTASFLHVLALLVITLLPLSISKVYGQTATLLKDIEVSHSTQGSLALYEAVEMNGFLYFTAYNWITGTELWKTDGTIGSVQIVKDIKMINSSNPKSLTVFNGELYFFAKKNELWKTDGTNNGTVLVQAFTNVFSLDKMVVANNKLIFSATSTSAANVFCIGSSDGTAAGSQILYYYLDCAANNSFNFYLTSAGNMAYFRAEDCNSNTNELWKTDGTINGTVLVKPFIFNFTSTPNISNLFGYNGEVYFAAYDNIRGRELWKSGGTASSTVLVKDINDNVNNALLYAGDSSSNPNSFYIFKNELYFVANDGETGNELWKTDGTSTGTVLVKDITNDYYGSAINHLFSLDSTLYFAANDNIVGTELWKTDGTNAGTMLVKDITVGAATSYVDNFCKFNNKLFFTTIYAGASTIWQSDGTDVGTTIITTLSSSPGSPTSFYSVNQSVCFNRNDGINGDELWATNGTSAFLLGDINGGTKDGIPNNVMSSAVFKGNLYFPASQMTTGVEIWKTDGTSNGTQLLANLNTVSSSSYPSNFTATDNVLFFIANPNNGYELCKTDGTTAGTVMVKDINVGSASSSPTHLTNINNILYFTANDGINGRELWKSDGTTAGTVMIKDITTGTSSSDIPELINFNNILYFTMPNVLPAYGRGIWKTDGTDTGTIVVAPLQQDEYLNGLTNVNGTLFFMLSNDINGFELGKLDNATGNVVMIKDIYAGGNSSFPSLFVNFNNTLYFVAKDSLHGKELWKSDGTEIGTVLVKDICDGLEDSSPTALTIVGNKLFFQAYDTLHGRELWATDGTDAGTYLVKDVYLGTESGVYQEMISTGDTLYFAGVSDINTEMELWKSDGTDIGTTLVSNISPIGSSSPKNFAILNQLLLFTAFHEDYGNEFWKLGITNTLSIDDNNDFVNHNYLIYPNPTSEFVYLKGNISQNTNIIIYNSLGIAVLSKNIASSIAESSIDVSELSEGIYFLNLVNEKENISCKIIVKGY